MRRIEPGYLRCTFWKTICGHDEPNHCKQDALSYDIQVALSKLVQAKTVFYMKRQSKIILMFAPFALFFVGLALLVHDMRHPTSSVDSCIVTGVGQDAQPYKATSPFLYRQGDNPLHDVSLRCNRFGVVMLNDAQLFITPVGSGEGAQVIRRTYRFLPERWMVSVRTGEKQVYRPQSKPGQPVPLLINLKIRM